VGVGPADQQRRTNTPSKTAELLKNISRKMNRITKVFKTGFLEIPLTFNL